MESVAGEELVPGGGSRSQVREARRHGEVSVAEELREIGSGSGRGRTQDGASGVRVRGG
jgi:hypothetical protein